jgi:plasmid stabilization system protein ParE
MAAGRRSVVWTDSARRALDEVLEYVAQDSRDRAPTLLSRVLDELDQPDTRELLVFDYRLQYRALNEQVVVIAFLHGARDFSKWRREQ